MNGELRGQEHHMTQAIHEMFVKPGFLTWNRWLEDHISIWCRNDFATVWGPAASGKSNGFGLLALMDWWSAPSETCVFVCSTDKKSLERRIWESIVRYFNLYARRAPGKISKMRTAIIQAGDRDLADEVKAGIHGVAIQQGTVEEAKSSLIGAHLPYVRLIIDEMQATRRAAVESRGNLSKGCKDFKLIGIGNPMSFLDPLGEYSEPKKGWKSVSVEDTEWDTHFGKCYHFDGFRSPAVLEENGAEKYPFLINQSQIDKDIRDRKGEADHPDIWTMCRGFVPPEGYTDALMSEGLFVKFDCFEKAKWQYEYKTVAGIDPAFSAGGDNCVLQVARVGRIPTGELVIEYHDPIEIQIKASGDLPIIFQIAEQVRSFGQDFGFGPEDLAVDETGTQSLGDVITEQWGEGVLRVYFGAKPTDLPVSEYLRVPCSQYYRDRATELWYTMYEFVKNSQIRNLPKEAAREYAERRIIHGMPKQIESKKVMKKRLGRSPDYGDAAALVGAIVRHRLGISPGSHNVDPMGHTNMTWLAEAQMYDLNARDDIYQGDVFEGAANYGS